MQQEKIENSFKMSIKLINHHKYRARNKGGRKKDQIISRR